jgi:hypothetical protein
MTSIAGLGEKDRFRERVACRRILDLGNEFELHHAVKQSTSPLPFRRFTRDHPDGGLRGRQRSVVAGVKHEPRLDPLA